MATLVIDPGLTKSSLEKVRRLLEKQGKGPFFNLVGPPPGINLTETAKRIMKAAVLKCPCCEAGLPRVTMDMKSLEAINKGRM